MSLPDFGGRGRLRLLTERYRSTNAGPNYEKAAAAGARSDRSCENSRRCRAMMRTPQSPTAGVDRETGPPPRRETRRALRPESEMRSGRWGALFASPNTYSRPRRGAKPGGLRAIGGYGIRGRSLSKARKPAHRPRRQTPHVSYRRPHDGIRVKMRPRKEIATRPDRQGADNPQAPNSTEQSGRAPRMQQEAHYAYHPPQENMSLHRGGRGAAWRREAGGCQKSNRWAA